VQYGGEEPRWREQWLSLAERLVLCLVSQEPSHGFALITTGARRGKVSTLRATRGRNMAPYWLLDSPYSLVSVKLVLLALQEP